MHAEAVLHVHGEAHLLERQQLLHAAMLVASACRRWTAVPLADSCLALWVQLRCLP